MAKAISTRAIKGSRVLINVRELRNAIERAVIITTSSTLQVELPGNQEIVLNQTRTLEDVQKEYILDTLEITKWRIRGKKGAAEILGLKPTTLESRMAKFGILRPLKKKYKYSIK